MLGSNNSEAQRRHAVTAGVVLLASVVWTGYVGALDTGSTGADVAPGRVAGGLVNAIVIDPAHPTTMYVGTNCAGVLKSMDAGATWGATGLRDAAVQTLVIDPRMARTLYAGTPGGGVYRSTDGAATWSLANVGLPDLNVGSLAIDPGTTSTLYATFGGAGGVFKSTDAGGSWQASNVVVGGLFRYVFALSIDPTTPDTLYVGGSDGVFKSTDAGVTWDYANTGFAPEGAQVLAIDPATPSTLYVAASSTAPGVFKSTDRGRTWEQLVNGLETNPVVVALAINPVTPSTLYAAVTGYQGTTGGVSKSTDGGITWKPARAGFPQPVSVGALAIDPTTPATLYAGTIDTPYRGSVFKSTDAAATWHSTGFVTGPICGDGIRTCEEPCDDGNLVDGDGCDSNCTVTGCGNGIVTSGEECDDGNKSSCDGCSATCQIETSFCGDGVLDANCEQCDDGNTVNGDGCEANCTLPRCGNGILDPAEECDDGNFANGDGCDGNCTLPRCGNGSLDAGEQCDDGNPTNGDGCENDCTLPRCGNSVVDAGEECDDGNRVNGDSCENDCTLPQCGNGILDAGEECDDGNFNPFDGCTNACTICGNGIVTSPEECDDGNTNPADGCTNACTVCGNGVVTPPEACDDGNLVNGDACDADCLGPSDICGNGRVEAGEECDEGGICIGGARAGTPCTGSGTCLGGTCTTFGGDGCAANCTTESDVAFYLVPGVSQSTDVPDIVPGTSGIVLHSRIITIPLPSSGSQSLRVGKERNGQIPVVIKAAGVHLARLPVAGIACFCPRAVAAKTCGGTIFEADGETLSPDCTPGFTAGASVCLGKNPCAFVHGPGNSASGVIGCNGLDGVNVSLTQDSGGLSGIAKPPLLTLSGTGGVGSAVLSATTALGPGIGRECTGTDPSVYGGDGELCTDDDPQSQRGTPLTAAVTTGTVTGRLLNVDQQDGEDIGPFTAAGAPFRCEALQRGDTSGAALASTFTNLSRPATTATAGSSSENFSFGVSLGDVLFTSFMVAGSPGPCVGDCDNSGGITVDELVTLVNVALGNAQAGACAAGVPGGAAVDVALLVQAVNNALNGCGG